MKMYGMHWNKKSTESYKRFYIAIAIVYTSRLKERIFEIYYEKFEIYAFSGASILPWKRASCKNFRAVNPRQELQMKKYVLLFFTNDQEKRIAGNFWTLCVSINLSDYPERNPIVIKIKY